MLIIGIFSFPDSLMIFLFMINLITWYLVIFKEKNILITVLPIILFMNTKYNSYLAILALIITYFYFKREKIRKYDIIVLFSSLIIGFLPVLLWNIFNDFSSFIWQFNHFFYGVGPRKDIFSKISEIINFYSLPVILISLSPFITRKYTPYKKWLMFIGIFLFIPLFFSALDSARNLLITIVPFLLLIEVKNPKMIIDIKKFVKYSDLYKYFFIITIILSSLFISFSSLKNDPIGQTNYNSLIKDNLGLKEVSKELENISYYDIVTPDIGLAGQLQYQLKNYSVVANWPQYRIWGIKLDVNVTIIAFSDSWNDVVQSNCQNSNFFGNYTYYDTHLEKNYYIWNCINRIPNQELFLKSLSYESI
jgi:hypothetical protein